VIFIFLSFIFFRNVLYSSTSPNASLKFTKISLSHCFISSQVVKKQKYWLVQVILFSSLFFLSFSSSLSLSLSLLFIRSNMYHKSS
jgi:hypothetical protein